MALKKEQEYPLTESPTSVKLKLFPAVQVIPVITSIQEEFKSEEEKPMIKPRKAKKSNNKIHVNGENYKKNDYVYVKVLGDEKNIGKIIRFLNEGEEDTKKTKLEVKWYILL